MLSKRSVAFILLLVSVLVSWSSGSTSSRGYYSLSSYGPSSSSGSTSHGYSSSYRSSRNHYRPQPKDTDYFHEISADATLETDQTRSIGIFFSIQKWSRWLWREVAAKSVCVGIYTSYQLAWNVLNLSWSICHAVASYFSVIFVQAWNASCSVLHWFKGAAAAGCACLHTSVIQPVALLFNSSRNVLFRTLEPLIEHFAKTISSASKEIASLFNEIHEWLKWLWKDVARQLVPVGIDPLYQVVWNVLNMSRTACRGLAHYCSIMTKNLWCAFGIACNAVCSAFRSTIGPVLKATIYWCKEAADASCDCSCLHKFVTQPMVLIFNRSRMSICSALELLVEHVAKTCSYTSTTIVSFPPMIQEWLIWLMYWFNKAAAASCASLHKFVIQPIALLFKVSWNCLCRALQPLVEHIAEKISFASKEITFLFTKAQEWFRWLYGAVVANIDVAGITRFYHFARKSFKSIYGTPAYILALVLDHTLLYSWFDPAMTKDNFELAVTPSTGVSSWRDDWKTGRLFPLVISSPGWNFSIKLLNKNDYPSECVISVDGLAVGRLLIHAESMITMHQPTWLSENFTFVGPSTNVCRATNVCKTMKDDEVGFITAQCWSRTGKGPLYPPKLHDEQQRSKATEQNVAFNHQDDSQQEAQGVDVQLFKSAASVVEKGAGGWIQMDLKLVDTENDNSTRRCGASICAFHVATIVWMICFRILYLCGYFSEISSRSLQSLFLISYVLLFAAVYTIRRIEMLFSY